MSGELRGGFFLIVSIVMFLLIIGFLMLSTVMRPNRWSERPRPVS